MLEVATANGDEVKVTRRLYLATSNVSLFPLSALWAGAKLVNSVVPFGHLRFVRRRGLSS